jgi:hypothetical protein
MSEAKPPEVPVPPVVPPVFPQGHTFPESLIKEWVSIPANEPVLIGPLARTDLDNFLFGFGDLTSALAELRQGLIEFSNGRLEHANAHLQNAINRNIDAESKHRMMFESIMKSVIEVRKNAAR